ncbi:16S rRNA (uracil(1498)-N(3))-methyltransferase [Paenibacillus sp. AK121]|uniref:16S rRNA (uracil(1498)-N(3))-methyltransferase n=1 Tax=Paenibacillus TaxID=44249 RepID=UPI001C24BD92|nr:16S rRNA (uracil(1498)-N(3))-methyltransferase [Paenibacillus sp. AK121]MBU9705723.1 16S rRNA (uracil(1498)-N(3))-methyltransferase [Paenibacillus sp. AK121]MEE4569586.1 16S rRNA (uracil(1498)-N(3))-methyltransferase [Paenibacillus polymyxa]
MQRYFIPAEQFLEDHVIVTGEDARHIAKVMRGRSGDKIIVSDGGSREALAALDTIEQDHVKATIIEPLEMTSEPYVQITIAQSLPKGDKMETVMQKCTEIGATGFVPFLSERTVVQYDAKKEGKRLERWRKIVKEAAEQSHRNRIPEISAPLTWKELLASFAGYDLICYCYEKEQGRQLRDVIQPFAGRWASTDKPRVLVVVGPEGGFTEAESLEAEQAGAQSTGLGRRILRAETAGMVALACILYETGEMGGV